MTAFEQKSSETLDSAGASKKLWKTPTLVEVDYSETRFGGYSADDLDGLS